MPFVHPSLLWALPLVGLPLLIHLINMARRRRVEWAAMEFLLTSQRKHRTWIVLKQLLLLLLRMAAIAAIVLMVAQPLLREQWGALLGGTKTHHVFLLDDSYSMSDRAGENSAFDTAKGVVAELSSQFSRQGNPQSCTLLRLSQFAGDGAQAGKPDFIEARVDSQFPDMVKATLDRLTTSESAARPTAALEAAERIPRVAGEDRVIYLLSDFRAKDWDKPADARQALVRLEADGSQLRMVNCVDARRNNLTLETLRPGPGTQAAGVPLLMEVAVHNYGVNPVKDVPVAIEEDGRKRPPVIIDEIPPGKTVTRRPSVMFPTAGQHQIVARLNPDTILADNVAYAIVDLPASVEVLVIDGDPKAEDAHFLITALAPGGKIQSGLKPLIETPRYLRDHPLDKFATIFLLNIDRLDPAETQALEAFAQAGGGVGFFLGERSRADFFNRELYREGQGIFPLPLSQPTQLLVDRLEKAPDLEVNDHPMFRVFAGERNSLINTVVVEWYFGAAKNWKPDPDSTTKVFARLRNGAPFAVERRFGAGRVVTILSKVAPVATPVGAWNNWGRDNPSFPVAMIELEAYLARDPRTSRSLVVGEPIEISFPATGYDSEVRFSMPQDKTAESLPVRAEVDGAKQTAAFKRVTESGVYQAQLRASSGETEIERFAVNVSPDEGDLRRLDSRELASRLAGINYRYHDAADLAYDTRRNAGFNLGERIMWLLVGLLLIEQFLAYKASYHPGAAQR